MYLRTRWCVGQIFFSENYFRMYFTELWTGSWIQVSPLDSTPTLSIQWWRFMLVGSAEYGWLRLEYIICPPPPPIICNQSLTAALNRIVQLLLYFLTDQKCNYFIVFACTIPCWANISFWRISVTGLWTNWLILASPLLAWVYSHIVAEYM